MKIKIIVSALLTSVCIYAQVPTGSPPTPLPAFSIPEVRNAANAAWYRGGNTTGNGLNNIFGTVAGFNSNIWHKTNGFNRLLMEKGFGTQTDGRIAIGNNLPNNFVPLSRLHIHQITGLNANGFMFRTDGLNSIDNLWEMFNGASPTTLSRKGRLYTSNAVATQFPVGIPSYYLPTFNKGYNHFNIGSDSGDVIINAKGAYNMAGPTYNNYGERMRISAYTFNGSSGYPVARTGVSISADPNNPITKPLSILHMGDPWFFNAAGHRNWMDYGTYITRESDNMYVGLKQDEEFPTSGDENDAVISWADNPPGFIGQTTYDELRFIFTTSNNSAFTGGNSANQHGLEAMRMVPTAIGSPINTNNINIGIGDYSFGGPHGPTSTKYVGAKLDIDGDLRIRKLTVDTSEFVLVADTGDLNRVHYRKISSLSSANGDNGLSTSGPTTGKLHLGQTTGAPGNPGQLLNNREIPLNNFNIRFNDGAIPTATDNRIELGYIHPSIITFFNPKFSSCNLSPNIRATGGHFSTIYNFAGLATPLVSSPYYFGSFGGTYKFGVIGLGVDSVSVLGGRAIGVSGFGYSKGSGTGSTAIGVSGKVYSNNITENTHGIYSLSDGNAQNSFGGSFFSRTYTGNVCYGVRAHAMGGLLTSIGVAGLATPVSSGLIPSSYPGGVSIGVYGSSTASVPSSDWAGYFDGRVFINGPGISPGAGLIFSDVNLKQNIVTVSKPLDLLLKLRPVSYNLNNAYAPQLNVDTAKTFGLIAQEVAIVLPELVKDVIVPAIYDSLGSVTTPSVTLKSLNYTGLIPLTISAIQDINSRQNVMQTQLNKAGLSDALVKTNINNFNALAKIKTLNPVSYNFTNANVPQLTFTPNLDYGFVAQQLQTVYPELVDTLRVPAKYDSLGAVINVSKVLKTVNYKAMSALLTRAIQEQQFKIDSLLHVASKQDSINSAVQTQITNLTNMINACCANSGAKTSNPSINQLDVELSDKDAIVLNQNVPNPFAEQTTITYNVPTSVTKAQLLFFNANGQIIQTVDIKTRGKGKVNVFASDLSSGLYHYTLVADGKVVDSKKMVRE